MNEPLLIETCMEGGVLTEGEIMRALAGQSNTLQIKAVLSMLECAIGNERLANESAIKRRKIDEHRGGANALKAVRRALLAYVASKPEENIPE